MLCQQPGTSVSAADKVPAVPCSFGSPAGSASAQPLLSDTCSTTSAELRRQCSVSSPAQLPQQQTMLPAVPYLSESPAGSASGQPLPSDTCSTTKAVSMRRRFVSSPAQAHQQQTMPPAVPYPSESPAGSASEQPPLSGTCNTTRAVLILNIFMVALQLRLLKKHFCELLPVSEYCSRIRAVGLYSLTCHCSKASGTLTDA